MGTAHDDEEVNDDDGERLPYWNPKWEIPYDTPEELAAKDALAFIEAMRRLDEEDPW